MDLFSQAGIEEAQRRAPLAARMRPRTVEEVLGQEHLLVAGSPLRRLIEGGASASSVILYGPPGTGKTTLAGLVAQQTGRTFVEISAVTSGIKDVREAIERATHELGSLGRETVLFIDEVHRFNKTQQDALLPAVENRLVTLIAATTENPSFSVVSPLLSRSLLLTLRPLEPEDIAALIRRAVIDARGLAQAVDISDEAVGMLVRLSGGDARRALTFLEASAGVAVERSEPILSGTHVTAAIDRALVAYDRGGDQHYDVASALIKSIRGSDVDAALHYLARMLEGGEDPRFIARRLIISASEDIGMADSQALQIAVSAAEAVALIGMPEARIILGHAVVYLSTAPKSNAAYLAINAAIADLQEGRIGSVPMHLRDSHYRGAEALGHGTGYQYPHDDERGILEQQYAPDLLADRIYYRPTEHGVEARVAERLRAIRAILGRAEGSGPA
jgi:putative ATPase